MQRLHVRALLQAQNTPSASLRLQRSIHHSRAVCRPTRKPSCVADLPENMTEERAARGTHATENAAITEQGRAKELPKLNPQEFRVYNHMAEHMDMFHNNFRQTWNMLYQAASSGARPSGMSIRQYISAGAQFCHHLTLHHTIEEQHIFPHLAKKMPAFQKELQLLTQHKEIHKGLEKFEDYLEKCRSGERELQLREVKEIMDVFGKVLWTHLDEEVGQLKAENMRKYWTLDEMKAMPM